jgi:PAS domain-containing protein
MNPYRAMTKAELIRLVESLHSQLNPKAQPRDAMVSECERRLGQIVEHAHEGIIVYDRNLHFLIWNRCMAEMTGVPAEAVVGKHPDEVFPFVREHGLISLIEKALRGETIPFWGRFLSNLAPQSMSQ